MWLRLRRRWVLPLVVLGLGLLGLVSCNAYLLLAEHVSPSTQVVLEGSGRGVALSQPNAPATPEGSAPADVDRLAGDAFVGRPTPRVASTAVVRAGPPSPQPPIRLLVPAIDVDAPVVLADNEHLPQFRAIGWFFGSAFPGTRGNLVLFGHLDGPNATLGRLRELRPGAGVYVVTRGGTYAYTVTGSRVVSRFDTAVMAPTRHARLTLITCAGRWLPKEGTYTDRLVVVARYAGLVEKGVGGRYEVRRTTVER